MAQDITANMFTLTDDSGSVQITYYPHAPGPLIQGQSSGGSRLDYQGSEGTFIFPHASTTVVIKHDSSSAPLHY